MMDLTAIATPFGLLDDATREALKAHGGPLEWFCTSGWKPWSGSIIPDHNHLTIRVKPQPPKPREWWINVHDGRAHPCHPNDNAAVMDSHIRVIEKLTD